MTSDDYLALITSEHRSQPLFAGVVRALTEPFAQLVNLELGLVEDFNLDTAIGAQLDALGLWVGISRQVVTPLTGVYFTWDGAPEVGWGSGYWQGPFDPSTGLVDVNDDVFRTLIRGKIAANVWDGTMGMLYDIWAFVFGPGLIQVQDNQDMTMTIIYNELALTPILVGLLLDNAFPLKPAGVRIDYVAVGADPIFAWDRSLPHLQGWTGASVWAP